METLEARQLLSVSSMLDEGPVESRIDAPGETTDLALSVSASATPVTLGVQLDGVSGGFDPASAKFFYDNGLRTPVPSSAIRYAGDDFSGTSSLVVIDLAPGDYLIEVGGEAGTTGAFVADVFLPGDLNGDGRVSSSEQTQLDAALVQSSGTWNPVTARLFENMGYPLTTNWFDSGMDADQNGVLTDFDMYAVQNNVGKGVVTVELVADQDPPAIDITPATGVNWATVDGTLYASGPELEIAVDDESDILSFQIGYEGTWIDYYSQIGVDGGNVSLDAAALANLGLSGDGPHTLEFIAADEHGNEYTLAAPFEFTYTVLSNNQTPVANNDAGKAGLQVVADGQDSVTYGVFANDTDADSIYGDVMKLAGTQGWNDAWGTLGLSENGALTFTPDPNFAGFLELKEGETIGISFEYKVQDALGAESNWAEVSIVVEGVNNAPQYAQQGDIQLTVGEDDSANTGLAALILGAFDDIDLSDQGNLSIVSVTPVGTVKGDMDPQGASFDPNGEFESLAVGESATQEYAVVVEDPSGAQATGTLLVTITGANDAPTAADGQVDDGVTEDSVQFDITDQLLALADDVDASDVLSLIDVSSQDDVTISQVGGRWYITPGASFNDMSVGDAPRSITLGYQVEDNHGAASNSGTVVVLIHAVNDVPTGVADNQLGTDEDTALPFLPTDLLGNDTDPDANDTLSIADYDLVSTKGATISYDGQSGEFTYNPTTSAELQTLAAGTATTDTFRYWVTDGHSDPVEVLVTVAIQGMNDPIVITPGQEFNVAGVADDELGPTERLVIGTVDFTDVDLGDSPTFSINLAGSSATDHAEILNNLQIDPATGEIYVEGPNTIPNDLLNDYAVTLAIDVIDGAGGSDSQTVLINVTPNQAPEIANDVARGASEETGFTIDWATLLAEAGITDPEGDAISLVVASGATGGGGTYSANANGSISYDPNGAFETLAQDATAADSITYTIEDSAGNQTQGTINITVTGENDAPTLVDANPVNVGVMEEAAPTDFLAQILAKVVDVDIPAGLSIDSITPVSGLGTLDANGVYSTDGEYNYLSDGQTATATFEVVVRDSEGASAAPITVNVTVTGENDPVALDDQSLGTVAGASDNGLAANEKLVLGTVAISDADTADGATFSIDLAGSSATAHTEILNNLQIDPATGEIFVEGPNTIPDDANANYTVSLKIDVTDGLSNDSGIVTITVTPNQAPEVGSDIARGATEEDGFSIGWNAIQGEGTITDPDGDAVSLVVENGGGWINTPNGGRYRTVSGGIEYDPNGAFETLGAGQTASDSITYTVEDTVGNQTTGTINITVTGVNDAPVVAPGAEVNEGVMEEAAATSFLAEILAKATDIDSPAGDLQIASVTRLSGTGSLSNAGVYDTNGTHDGLAAGETATDVFEVVISDGSANAVETVTVNITVTGENDAPEANEGVIDWVTNVAWPLLPVSPTDVDLTGDYPTNGWYPQYDLGDLSTLITDPDGDALTYTVSFSNEDLVYAAGATDNGDGTYTLPNGQLDLVSKAYWAGQDWTPTTVTVKATDAGGDFVSYSFDLKPELDASVELFVVIRDDADFNQWVDYSADLPSSATDVVDHYYVELWVKDNLDPALFPTQSPTLPPNWGVSTVTTDMGWLAPMGSGSVSNLGFHGFFGGYTGIDYAGQEVNDFGTLADLNEGLGRSSGLGDYLRVGYFQVTPDAEGPQSFLASEVDPASPYETFQRYIPGTTQSQTVHASQYVLNLDQVAETTDTFVTLDTLTPSVPLQAKQVADVELAAGVYLGLVETPSQTDDAGRIAEMPTSETWIDEWDSHWVELWVNASQADQVLAAGASLQYNGEFFTATDFEYGPGVNGLSDVTIDDATGLISGIRGEAADGELGGELGGEGLILLGRVKFESLEGDNVPLGAFTEAQDMGVALLQAQFELADGEVTNVAMGDAPTTELWAVPYDLNDDGQINRMDYALFRGEYASTIDADSAMAAAMDFDNSGGIDRQDFAFFRNNYGGKQGDDGQLTFPSNFVRNWVGESVDIAGDATLDELLDAANNQWQTALGLGDDVDVQVFVQDLEGSQLASARITGLNEQGLPETAVLVIDDDAAGAGWFGSIDAEAIPSDKYDLYTTLLHELGHAYGFTTAFAGFGQQIVTSEDGTFFVGLGANVAMDAGGEHLSPEAHGDDLMAAELGLGEQKSISNLDRMMLIQAYGARPLGTGGLAAGQTSALFAAAQPTSTVETDLAVTVGSNDSNFADSGLTMVGLPVTSQAAEAGEEQQGLSDAMLDELYRSGVAVTIPADTTVVAAIVEESVWDAWADQEDEGQDAEHSAEGSEADQIDRLMAELDIEGIGLAG